jgi:hypothetical protein
MSLFDAKMVDKMLATASRNDQSSAVNKQWDSTMESAEKPVDAPKDLTAIQESFDYVYDRLGGHEAFFEWAQFNPKNLQKFYEWRAKSLQKESSAPVSEGKVVINVLNYNESSDSVQLQASGLPIAAVPSVRSGD